MSFREYITPIGNEGLYVLDTASWRNFKPVMDKNMCTECGICSVYCPVGSIYRGEQNFLINYQYCKGCGICSKECPKKAIDMVREEGKNNG